jgi:hypothetical protein
VYAVQANALALRSTSHSVSSLNHLPPLPRRLRLLLVRYVSAGAALLLEARRQHHAVSAGATRKLSRHLFDREQVQRHHGLRLFAARR